MTTQNDPTDPNSVKKLQQPTEQESMQVPPQITAKAQSAEVNLKPFSHYLSKLLLCNLLYLASAALLLYSFYLVAADVDFFRTDLSRLSMNLGSLQVYEILLVTTGIWLASRRIWYDSTLLVGLENLLLLAPFILLSEAALIDRHLVWILTIGATAAAILRLGGLRRYFRELNLPPRMLGIGIGILVINAAMLLAYRTLHQNKYGQLPDFGAAYETNQYAWWILLPAICTLASVVPFPRVNAQATWPQKPWLPFVFFTLWLAGTCVHFYSLAYVYDFVLRPDMVAPALWVVFWVCWFRFEREVPGLSGNAVAVLWTLPALTTVLATSQPNQKVLFLALTALNIVIYTVLYWNHRTTLGLHLAVLSAVALLAGLPAEWIRHLGGITREQLLGSSLALYVLAWVTSVRDPKLALLGAFVAGLVAANLTRRSDASLHWAAQAAAVYFLLHSFRWNDAAEKGSGFVRWIAACAWVLDSFAWMAEGGGWRIPVIGLTVLGTWVVMRLLGNTRLPRAVPASAALVSSVIPLHQIYLWLGNAPAGLLALLGSLLLFGCGTLVALARGRLSANTAKSAEDY